MHYRSIILNLGGQLVTNETTTPGGYNPSVQENRLAEFVSVILQNSLDEVAQEIRE